MVNTLLLIFSVASISLVAIIGISCGAVLVFFIIRFVLRVLLAGRGKPTSEKTIYERRYFPFCSIEIEDGRLYEILSSSSSEIRIACVERYKAEEKRLYCYAYLSILPSGVYELHVRDPRDTIRLRDFVMDHHLNIIFDRCPTIFLWGNESLSPFIPLRDYLDFSRCLKKAGCQWNIEQGGFQQLGDYTYKMMKKKRRWLKSKEVAGEVEP
jgi:hypothetical protein